MAKRSGLSTRSGSIQAAIVAAKGEAAVGDKNAVKAKSAQLLGRTIGLTVRLDQRTHDRLRKVAFDERVSIHSLLLEGVEAALKRHESHS
jgi:hypothetical protein